MSMKGWRVKRLSANMKPSYGLGRSVGQIALGFLIIYAAFAFFLPRSGPQMGILLGMLGIAVALPLIVPGVIGLVPAMFRSIHAMHMGPWQGRYYEFQGYQVRILERDGMLWVSVADLNHALGKPIRPGMLHTVRPYLADGFSEIRGQALSEHGVRIVLDGRADAVAVKFSIWFEQQVCAPWVKRRKLEAAPNTARSSQE